MKFKSLRSKLVFATTCLALVVVMITGVMLYFQSWSQIFSEIQERILAIAQTAASNVNGEQHSMLLKYHNEESVTYLSIQQYLRKVRNENPDLAFVYSLAKDKDGGIIIVVDGAEGEEHVGIGHPYDSNHTVEQAFLGTPSVLKDFEVDEWGTFLTAYAPIFNSVGDVAAVLSVDLDASRVLAARRKQLLMTALIAIVSSACRRYSIVSCKKHRYSCTTDC